MTLQRPISSNQSYLIKLIVKYINDLNYELEDWDLEYVKSILTRSSFTRNALLFWVLNLLGLSYTISEQRNFSKTIIKKILNDLSTLGICKPQESNLIEGNGSSISQLIFWKSLLELCVCQGKLKELSSIPNISNEHLYSLVSSYDYQESLQEEEFNLLPKDLKYKFKNWKEGSVELAEELKELRKEVGSEQNEIQASVLEEQDSRDILPCLSSLSSQVETLLSIHEGSLNPWCKLSGAEPQHSSKIEDLLLQCSNELKTFEQHVDLSMKVFTNNEQIDYKFEDIKDQKISPATHLLESVVRSVYS